MESDRIKWFMRVIDETRGMGWNHILAYLWIVSSRDLSEPDRQFAFEEFRLGTAAWFQNENAQLWFLRELGLQGILTHEGEIWRVINWPRLIENLVGSLTFNNMGRISFAERIKIDTDRIAADEGLPNLTPVVR